MGAEIYLYILIGETKLIARVSPRSTSRAGDTIKIALDTARMHIFDKDTEKCIVH
jgi:multiple sugar transport system ATP-binding protein